MVLVTGQGSSVHGVTNVDGHSDVASHVRNCAPIEKFNPGRKRNPVRTSTSRILTALFNKKSLLVCQNTVILQQRSQENNETCIVTIVFDCETCLFVVIVM